jgi:hypothetical protein
MKRLMLILAILALALTGTATQVAAKKPVKPPPPVDFLFGNHIDTHQQTNLSTVKETGDPLGLTGNLLIFYPAGAGNDHKSGLPLARHPRGADHDEECGVDVTCVTGWVIKGVPGAAKFVSHSGVNGDDHAVWLVNREPDELLAGVSAIPQPGFKTHFHWISKSSGDPREASVPDACDKNNAGQLQTTVPSAVNDVCQGWFLHLDAIIDFAFQHGGEVIPVRAGHDNRSHLNILTNYEIAPVLPAGSITPTR